MSTQPLEQAIQSTRAVLAQVRPDQLSDRTPCQSWKVSDLINHVVGTHAFFLSCLNGSAPPAPADVASGDFVAAFDKSSAETVAAFNAEGVMQQTIALPFGQMPAPAVIGLAATDTFQHGWDIAKATGQTTDLAPQLAEQLLSGAKMAIPDSFRGPDGKAPFGPEQQAPPGSSNADRLAAFLGRTV